MFGKIFETMFEGSLVGRGPLTFAVWGYVIAKQRPDRKVGSQVRLHPAILAAIFGAEEEEVQKVIEKFCEPDPKSSSKEEGGRRLVKLGEFEYRVVNGAKYRAIRDEEQRREQNRESQRRWRGKKGNMLGGEGGRLPGEGLVGDGGDEGEIADRVNDEQHRGDK
jgi:hypothetical protein